MICFELANLPRTRGKLWIWELMHIAIYSIVWVCEREGSWVIWSEGNFYSYLCYNVLQLNTYIYSHFYPCGDLTVLCFLIFYFCYNFGCLLVCLFLFGRKKYWKNSIRLVWIGALWSLRWYLACGFVSLRQAIWRFFAKTYCKASLQHSTKIFTVY